MQIVHLSLQPWERIVNALQQSSGTPNFTLFGNITNAGNSAEAKQQSVVECRIFSGRCH